jgi:hypothetical protein
MWHSRNGNNEALTKTMLYVQFLKCSCTKRETLLDSLLYTTLRKPKPKTHPHAAECWLRIRVTQMVNKCTTFHTDRGFIIVFTTVPDRTTLSLIESVTHNSHLVPCLRIGLVPSDFQTTVYSVFLPSATCFTLFEHPINIWRRIKIMTLSIIVFLLLPSEALSRTHSVSTYTFLWALNSLPLTVVYSYWGSDKTGMAPFPYGDWWKPREKSRDWNYTRWDFSCCHQRQ